MHDLDAAVIGDGREPYKLAWILGEYSVDHRLIASRVGQAKSRLAELPGAQNSLVEASLGEPGRVVLDPWRTLHETT